MKERYELRPCPFCGSKAWIQHFPVSNTYEARCGECGIGTWPQLNRQAAVDKWNRRGGRRQR